MTWLLEFFKGFWTYVSLFTWWQGLIIIATVLIIIFIGKNWKNVINWIGDFFTGKGKIRSCGDCIIILFSKEAKHLSERKKVTGRVLEDQMLFASQKIDSLYLEMIDGYRKDIIKFRKEGIEIDHIVEEKEYISYREMLSNAFDLVKRELRRSFKENGFKELSGKAFSEYVKNETRHLIDIAKSYLVDRYPDKAVVPLDYRFEHINYSKIEDIAFDVYTNAKEIMKNADIKTEEIDKNFVEEIDEFIKSKK